MAAQTARQVLGNCQWVGWWSARQLPRWRPSRAVGHSNSSPGLILDDRGFLGRGRYKLGSVRSRRANRRKLTDSAWRNTRAASFSRRVLGGNTKKVKLFDA